MDKNELTQKLTALLSKQDRRDQFNAENLHTLAEAALILLEEGGGAGIADVPMEVETIEPNDTPEAVMRGETLVFRIPQGEQGNEGPEGKSAYQVWLDDNGFTAEQHPVSEYINSLKAHVSRFIPIATESGATSLDVGDTYAFSNVSNPTDGAMLLMPNGDTTTPKTLMFSVTSNGGTPETFTYTYVGELSISTEGFLSFDKIVQDLNTGGANKVLSADAGQLLQQDVARLRRGDKEVEYVPSLLRGWLYSGYINNAYLQWRGSTGSYRYAILPINGRVKITVKANASKNAQLFFLKSYSGHLDNQAVDAVGCQKTSIVVSAGGESTVSSPADAKYLYVYMVDGSGVSTCPESLKITGADWLSEVSESVNELLLEGGVGDGCFILPSAYGNTSLTDKWRAVNNAYGYKLTGQTDGVRGGLLKVKANGSYAAYIAIVAELPPDSAKDTVVWANGYKETVEVAVGAEVEFFVPSDAVYIQIWGGKSSTAAYTPEVMSLVKVLGLSEDSELPGLLERVDNLDERVYQAVEVYEGLVSTNVGYLAYDTEPEHGYYRHSGGRIWFKHLADLGIAAGDIVEVAGKTAENGGEAGLVLFLVSGGDAVGASWTSNNAVVLAGEPERVLAGEVRQLVVPEGATKIWVQCVSGLGNDVTPARVELKKSGVSVSEGLSIEERIVQLKAALLTNMKWTPKAATIPYHGSGNFYAVQEYKGLPYSSNTDHGKWLGTHVSLYTFLTAVNNKYSLLYTETLKTGAALPSAWGYVYTDSTNGSSYYGLVCCAFTGYVSGAFVVWNNPDFYDHPANFELIQAHTQEGHVFDLNKLKVGDILDTTQHSFIVVELTKDKDGMVTGYVAKESTTGLDGTTVKGAWTRPASNFPGDLSVYDHFRYRGIGTNTHIRDTDSGVYGDDGSIAIEYNNDICAVGGDKCTFTNHAAVGYLNGNVVALTFNLTDDANWAYSTIVVSNLTTGVANSYTIADIVISGYDSRVQGHALRLENVASGKYEAWCTGDGIESEKTRFIVVGTDDVTIAKTEEGIRVTANNKDYRITYIAAYLSGVRKGNVSPLSVEPETWELANVGNGDTQHAVYGNHSLLLPSSSIDGYSVAEDYVLYIDVMTEYGTQRMKGIVA